MVPTKIISFYVNFMKVEKCDNFVFFNFIFLFQDGHYDHLIRLSVVKEMLLKLIFVIFLANIAFRMIKFYHYSSSKLLLRLWQVYQAAQVITGKTGILFPKRLVYTK